MSRLTICSACEMGNHKRHREVVQAVPPGMLGGSVCTCRGECADHRYRPKYLRELAELFARAGARIREASDPKEDECPSDA